MLPLLRSATLSRQPCSQGRFGKFLIMSEQQAAFRGHSRGGGQHRGSFSAAGERDGSQQPQQSRLSVPKPSVRWAEAIQLVSHLLSLSIKAG